MYFLSLNLVLDYSYVAMGIICAILSVYFIKKESRRITNGILIMLSLFFMFVGILDFIFVGDSNFVNKAFYEDNMKLLVVVFTIFLSVLVGIVLVINIVKVVKAEFLSLDHILPLIFGGFAMLFLMLFLFVMPQIENMNSILLSLLVQISFFSLLYIPGMLMSFLIYSIVYNWLPKKKECDFLIILGANLKNKKEVTPLLAKRLDRGIEIYNISKIKPKIIVSGGRGEGQKIAESYAMKKYLLKRGICEAEIIQENRSKNTFENMKYSKEILDNYKEGCTCIFVTSNFHVLRAAIQARAVGLDAHGFGAKTSFSTMPIAFLREYVAVIFKYKKLAFSYIVCVVLFNLTLLFFLL